MHVLSNKGIDIIVLCVTSVQNGEMFQNIYLAAVKEKIIPHKVNQTMKHSLNATANRGENSI